MKAPSNTPTILDHEHWGCGFDDCKCMFTFPVLCCVHIPTHLKPHARNSIKSIRLNKNKPSTPLSKPTDVDQHRAKCWQTNCCCWYKCCFLPRRIFYHIHKFLGCGQTSRGESSLTHEDAATVCPFLLGRIPVFLATMYEPSLIKSRLPESNRVAVMLYFSSVNSRIIGYWTKFLSTIQDWSSRTGNSLLVKDLRQI